MRSAHVRTTGRAVPPKEAEVIGHLEPGQEGGRKRRETGHAQVRAS